MQVPGDPPKLSDWESEFDRGERFAFGENWTAYLRHIDENRIALAEESLKAMLEIESLDAKRFLDIGSGSGLFSLAARRLGADVVSFDYDPQSVACTAELRRRFFSNDGQWDVMQGSVLEQTLVRELGSFDIVYSWGVLHHTGSMWQALANAGSMVATGGLLAIAIYNDQGRASRTWKRVKKAYVGAPGPLKWAVLVPAFVRLWGPTVLRDTMRGRPSRTWRSYAMRGNARGMHPWRDVVDWVGGYPFEVAKPEEIFDFFRKRGFEMIKLHTCGGGLGCNEFVFRRELQDRPAGRVT
jgi:2-polyprenyl-3-methyl-5-hydroxy-6-metoxy-1,4-benzoquinol methylase